MTTACPHFCGSIMNVKNGSFFKLFKIRDVFEIRQITIVRYYISSTIEQMESKILY